MAKEKIVSFAETSKIRITDFSDWFKKRHPEKMELLKTDDFIVITGEGIELSCEIPHDCNCEYCEETENFSKFVENESDVEKAKQDIVDEYELNENDIEQDKYFYVKAVRQNYDIGGLLNG